ncbi:MAG: HU family DNA-binding protein [Phycisphaeraceae bacterium]|nr:HU family DNA-binding protein [Phycisphaeraceae bacterium]
MAKKKAATKTNTDAKKPMNKSAVYNAIAESTELTRKQVAGVFDELSNLIKKNLGPRGPGVFVVPGLMKMVTVKKPAQKAGARIVRNPATGEMMPSKAKPASRNVRIRALKNLKDMV